MCQKKLQVSIEKKNIEGKIINMMIIFHFIFKILKNPIVKVELDKII